MFHAFRICQVSKTLCRTYATESLHSDTRLVKQTTRAGRHMSAPKAVRERREARKINDIPRDDFSPTEWHNFRRQFVLGELVGKGKDGEDMNQKEWLERLNEKRQRIRGIHIKTTEEGRKDVQAVGQKIYLPNIIFKLVRNFTPRGEPYNPFQATFRVPQSVTKTDIRSYLYSVYGVEVTYIRTDNYLSPLLRTESGSWSRTIPHKTYKRAVVGLVEPFYYPKALEDMTSEERKEWETFYEQSFQIKSQKTFRKEMLLQMTKGSRAGNARNGLRWKWRNASVVSRKQILRSVGERRARRELDLLATSRLMVENRNNGVPADRVDFTKVRKDVEEGPGNGP